MSSLIRILTCMGFIVGLALGLLAPAVQAQEPADRGQLTYAIAVPSPLTRQEVREIVELSVAKRQWTIQSAGDDTVVGYLKHRGYEATVTFVLGDSEVRMYCVGWVVNKAGERVAPQLPSGWLVNLDRDIRTRFGALAATR